MFGEDSPDLYTLDEAAVTLMIKIANEQIDILADLLCDKTVEDPLDLKLITLLCDSFSSNYHIWRILKSNLNYNLIKNDGEENIIALNETDIIITEQAILARAFTKAELLRLNCSLSLH